MPTQKTFKQRIRTRMTKTGESYTAARHQLLRKATEPTAPDVAPKAVDPTESDAFGVSDDSMLRATGKRHAEWFALLDAWGATERRHPEIARWLSQEHGVPPWWTQSVTVAYERARGLRARHQMQDGFSVSATRTVAADAERTLEAFTSAPRRRRWLPDAPMRQRPTRAALSARFDWADPKSRVVVTMVRKGSDKTTVAVSHEQIQDAETAERLKADWRERLGALKAYLERT